MNYFLKDQYEKNLTEVTNTKNNDGLSGVDKMSMNLDKFDESTVVFADLNIEMTMKRVLRMHDFTITRDEQDYYMEHLNVSDIQREYVLSFYAKYFGNFRDLDLLSRRQYITLLLVMKKILLLDLGYDPETKEVKEAALPYILSGNLEDRVVSRMIRNAKFNDNLDNSYKYRRIVDEDYAYLQEIDGKQDFIKSRLSTLTNTKFTYVTYEDPSLTGTEIIYDENCVADELMDLLDYI